MNQNINVGVIIEWLMGTLPYSSISISNEVVHIIRGMTAQRPTSMLMDQCSVRTMYALSSLWRSEVPQSINCCSLLWIFPLVWEANIYKLHCRYVYSPRIRLEYPAVIESRFNHLDATTEWIMVPDSECIQKKSLQTGCHQSNAHQGPRSRTRT